MLRQNFQSLPCLLMFFFCHDPPPTQLCTLSLHDALPISAGAYGHARHRRPAIDEVLPPPAVAQQLVPKRSLGTSCCRSEEHTLNSSHLGISYAVFCLKKKKRNRSKVSG